MATICVDKPHILIVEAQKRQAGLVMVSFYFPSAEAVTALYTKVRL